MALKVDLLSGIFSSGTGVHPAGDPQFLMEQVLILNGGSSATPTCVLWPSSIGCGRLGPRSSLLKYRTPGVSAGWKSMRGRRASIPGKRGKERPRLDQRGNIPDRSIASANHSSGSNVSLETESFPAWVGIGCMVFAAMGGSSTSRHRKAWLWHGNSSNRRIKHNDQLNPFICGGD